MITQQEAAARFGMSLEEAHKVRDRVAKDCPDMTLTKRHGYYQLGPNTPAGEALVREVRDAKRTDIGTDFEGENILLDGFFAAAGDWCRDNVLPRGLTLQWGESFYAGEQGMAALFEECA